MSSEYNDNYGRNFVGGHAHGYSMNTQGDYRLHITRVQKGPGNRVGVIFGSEIAQDVQVFVNMSNHSSDDSFP